MKGEGLLVWVLGPRATPQKVSLTGASGGHLQGHVAKAAHGFLEACQFLWPACGCSTTGDLPSRIVVCQDLQEVYSQGPRGPQ